MKHQSLIALDQINDFQFNSNLNKFKIQFFFNIINFKCFPIEKQIDWEYLTCFIIHGKILLDSFKLKTNLILPLSN